MDLNFLSLKKVWILSSDLFQFFTRSMNCFQHWQVLAESRGEFLPDPRFDAINIVALGFQNDSDIAIDVLVLLHCKLELCQRYAESSMIFRIWPQSEIIYLFQVPSLECANEIDNYAHLLNLFAGILGFYRAAR